MNFYKYIIILIAIILNSQKLAFSQEDTVKLRKSVVIATDVAIYGMSYSGMYFLWYKNNPTQKFHFFNDSKEWVQMDKFGHGFSTYYITNILFNELTCVNYGSKKSANYALLSGFITVSTIEIFDGFYKNWGASVSDLGANISGGSLFYLQQRFWNEQRIVPKFSFHKTDFAQARPELLGDNTFQNIFKDYNGQTYWLSVNINSFLNFKKFPNWLNVAFGYSADGMVGGSNNSFLQNVYPNSLRKREYIFSLDLDLRRIKTKNKILKSVLTTINVIKFPFPAVKFYDKKIKFVPVYF